MTLTWRSVVGLLAAVSTRWPLRSKNAVDHEMSVHGGPLPRYTSPRYRHDPRPIGLHPMDIPETHVKTAAFLCVDQGGGAEAKPRATAFFVMDRSGAEPYPVWAVTGRHCIENARATGRQLYTPRQHQGFIC